MSTHSSPTQGRRIFSMALLLIMLLVQSVGTFVVKAQKKQKEAASAQQETPPSTPKSALEFGLSEDTPVRLRLNRTISSATENVGDKVDFDVLEAVKIGDIVVIEQGAKALATVTEAKHKGHMGKAGKLNVNIDYIQAASGEKIPLRAVKNNKGGSHTGAMTGAIVASSIIFFPAAPLFLFMKGKDVTIPKGTEITAYVAADTSLDRSKFTK